MNMGCTQTENKIKDSILNMYILKHIKMELHNTVPLGWKKSYCTCILWKGCSCGWQLASSVFPSDLIYEGVLAIKSDKPIHDVKETKIKKVQFATCENFMRGYYCSPCSEEECQIHADFIFL